MEKWLIIIKKLYYDQRMRFLFVGGLNTVLGYALYALFVSLGLSATMATTAAMPLSVLNSYLWNKFFTFKSPGKSLAEVLKFLSVYAVSYLLNLSTVYVFADLLNVNEYLAGALSIFTSTVISYVGHHRFSFAKKKEKE